MNGGSLEVEFAGPHELLDSFEGDQLAPGLVLQHQRGQQLDQLLQ